MTKTHLSDRRLIRESGEFEPPRPLHVVVDGLIYGVQKHGGINSYFNEILPRIAHFPQTRVDFFVPAAAMGALPGSPVRLLRRELLPNVVSERPWARVVRRVVGKINSLVFRARVSTGTERIIHSSYITCIGGANLKLGTVYDLNHEIFASAYDTVYGRWLRQRYREYICQVDWIIAISEKTKRDVSEFYGVDPSIIDVIHLAPNRSVFWPEPRSHYSESLTCRLNVQCPYILYVGSREQRYKNFDGLINGLSNSSMKRDLSLVVAGKQWEPHEVQHIRSLGLESRVHLVVEPTDTDLRTLYSGAAAFVYPSFHEGFGIPILEAMACGTLVLAANTEVFHEVAGDAAIYFDPSDPREIAGAIESCMTATVREEYVARGLKQVSKFSWDRCAEETYWVYQKAMKVRTVRKRFSVGHDRS